MKNEQKTLQSGFTIIELLIVLGVAGMIFTIIFNAVPAIIRNSHNNQRKQDVSAVLSSVSRFQLNNSGIFPNGAAWDDQFNNHTKISFYDKSKIVLHPPAAADLVVTAGDVNEDEIQIYNFHLCDPDTGGAISTGAGSRDIVAVYNIETSGGAALKCQQL